MGNRYSIAQLSRGISHRSGRRIMALLRAYFDASRTTKAGLAERVTCVGGYVGPEDDWLKVEREWSATCAMWGIEEFHLSSILAGKVHRVGRELSEQCVLSFVNVMRRADLTGIVAGIREDDWLSIEKSKSDAMRFPTSYHVALHMALGTLEDHVRSEYPDDEFEVYADLDSESPEANAIRDELRANPKCINVAFVRRDRVPLIQCADLCAGLARMEWLKNGFIPKRAPTTKLGWSSYAKRSRGAFWSIEAAKMIAEATEQMAKRRAENAAKSSLT